MEELSTEKINTEHRLKTNNNLELTVFSYGGYFNKAHQFTKDERVKLID